jgi:hypothetical protein
MSASATEQRQQLLGTLPVAGSEPKHAARESSRARRCVARCQS